MTSRIPLILCPWTPKMEKVSSQGSKSVQNGGTLFHTNRPKSTLWWPSGPQGTQWPQNGLPWTSNVLKSFPNVWNIVQKIDLLWQQHQFVSTAFSSTVAVFGAHATLDNSTHKHQNHFVPAWKASRVPANRAPGKLKAILKSWIT